eukprot:scaffold123316_cov65-Phaeocystis_antarctica.AAC.1
MAYRLAPSGEARCTGTVNLIVNGFMQGGVFPSFLTDTSTVPGGGPCSSSPCTGATRKGGTLSVVTEASLFGPYSLSFVNTNEGSPLFTKASLPAGRHSVEAATGDTFTFRALCRAGGAQGTALGRMIVSSNLPENGWPGAKHSGSNGGWADCTSSAWTKLSGEHTVTQGAGVRVGFRIDNRGGTILWDGFELLRNPGSDEQLSEEECRTAATLYGWAISVVSSSDRPKGCHYSPKDVSSPAFFYNAYAGMAFSSTAYGGDYLAVCKRGTAFPSPPPSSPPSPSPPPPVPPRSPSPSPPPPTPPPPPLSPSLGCVDHTEEGVTSVWTCSVKCFALGGPVGNRDYELPAVLACK